MKWIALFVGVGCLVLAALSWVDEIKPQDKPAPKAIPDTGKPIPNPVKSTETICPTGTVFTKLPTPGPRQPEQLGPNKWKVLVLGDRENITDIDITAGQTVRLLSVTGETKMYGCDAFTNPPQGRYLAKTMTAIPPNPLGFILPEANTGALLVKAGPDGLLDGYADIGGRLGSTWTAPKNGRLVFVTNNFRDGIGDGSGYLELTMSIE